MSHRICDHSDGHVGVILLSVICLEKKKSNYKLCGLSLTFGGFGLSVVFFLERSSKLEM